MKFTKKSVKLIILSLVVVLAAAASFKLGHSGINVAQVVTEGRCQAGAFLAHSDRPGSAASDTDGHITPSTPGNGQSSQPLKTAQATAGNLIPNGDIETGFATPDNWLNNVYGQSKVTFSQVKGHDSHRALQVVVDTYTNGDANWYYPFVEAKPGQYYEFRNYYQSTTATSPILTLRHDDGQDEYIRLGSAEPARDWTLYSAKFFVPDDVHKLMVYHPLAAAGTLVTDDYSLQPIQPAGFNQPLVSLTFDDGWESIYQHAFPLMERYGFDSTQYLVSGYIGQAADYVTPKQVYDMRRQGHEIASHTVDHLDLTKQSPAASAYQLKRSQQDLTKCFGHVTGFAEPYGAHNAQTTQTAAKYYQTVRSTDAGFNTADSLSFTHIVVQNLEPDTTSEQVQSWLRTAKQNRAWLVLVYHQIENNPGGYSRTPAKFEQDLKDIRASGITVKTVQAATTELAPQVQTAHGLSK